ncbi:hypothetical protein FBU59_003288 [Linderina macrospora]|uniref:Uncharacterized protein n=1 Tax=Linderina macrospora TaxID=4868 RepID=A0ACC1J8Y7_9FUNG|nr:hypothetical protein FBU59_003288 [Linderina macrospora]
MKYQSFTRQFHLYRFRRIADGRRDKKYKGYCRFFHQDFLRDHPHLISSITRVKVSKTSAAARKERREKAAKSAKTKTKAMAKTEAAAKSTQTHSRAVSVSTKPPSASAPVSHGGTVSPAALLMQSDGLSSPELEQTAPEFNTPVARDAIKSLQVLEDVFEELDLQGKSRRKPLHSRPPPFVVSFLICTLAQCL